MKSWVRRSEILGDVFLTFTSMSSQSEQSIGPMSFSHLSLALSATLSTDSVRRVVYRVEMSLSGSGPVITSTIVSDCGLGKPFANCV